MKKTRMTGCLLLLLLIFAAPLACGAFQPVDVSAAPAKYTGWQQEGKRWYYYKKGIKQKGWLTLEGKTYFLSKKKNYRLTNLHTIKGKIYYFDSEGVMVTKKWVTAKKNRYYMGADGAALVNKWKTTKKMKYRLGGDGAMLAGMQKIGKKTYYFNPEDTEENGITYPKGCRRSGSFRVQGKWYYFQADGIMLTASWNKQGGKWYYYQEDGTRKTGWLTLDDKRYYLKSNGVMAVNETLTIGGKQWTFDENGVAAESQGFTYDSDGYVRVRDSDNRYYTLEKEYAKHTDVANNKISDKELLTAAVYCEAGNQGLEGMTATAMVILNRTLAPQFNFPPSLRYVIYQKGQFTIVRDGKLLKCLNNMEEGNLDVAEKAVDRAYIMYNAYVQNKTKRTRYLQNVLKKSNGKKDFDCLFFMTPAAYSASGLTSKSEAFTYKGQTFFTYWK